MPVRTLFTPSILLFLLTLALSARAETPEPVAGRYLIDVRTPAEWQTGHLAGAIHLPQEQVALKVGELLPDRDTPIALYCRSGRRSARVAALLERMGYRDVIDYGGLRQAAHRVAAEQGCEGPGSC